MLQSNGDPVDPHSEIAVGADLSKPSGHQWAAVTGHPLATQAAREALERGGSVVDAAVAASAVLTVVSTHANSLGSDAFMLLRLDGRIVGLNASGTAPARASLSRFGGSVPRTGPNASVVPGLVKLWEAAHRARGRLPWRSLFDRAVQAAEAGHPLSHVVTRNLASKLSVVGADPGCRALYFDGDKPRLQGSLFRQPKLARTLGSIADEGAAAFYEGWIASSIANCIRAAGGVLAAEDLSRFTAVWEQPLHGAYRDFVVHVMPPNSFGTLLLMQLNALAAIEPGAFSTDPVQGLGYFMNAAAVSINEACPLIADPAASSGVAAMLLSAGMTARLRAAVRGPAVPISAALPGGTTGLVIADGKGEAVALLQSNFQPFGSGVLDPGTGILLNNRMLCFSADPSAPNSLAPGKRPAHTLNPLMVTQNDELRFALVTPGGVSQTITCAQVLINRIDRSWPLSRSIGAPRWSVDSHAARLIEEPFPEDYVARLAKHGHVVQRASGSDYFGSVKAIERTQEGSLTAFADHRRSASADAA